jgi:anti-sigma regulatory factor (Ser/Thr protein kinase)
VRLAGYLDATGAAAVRAAVLDCLAAEPDAVVVDVGQLNVGTHDLAPAIATLARQADRWPGCALVLADAEPALAAGAGVRSYPSVAAVRLARADGRARDHLRETMPAAPIAAPLARRLVERACRAWSVPDLMEPAQLVVTELVANAVRHAGHGLAVSASLRDGQLRISVADDDPVLPRPGAAGPTDEHGRGLLMVETISRDWGAMRLTTGKVVWARFGRGDQPRTGPFGRGDQPRTGPFGRGDQPRTGPFGPADKYGTGGRPDPHAAGAV